MMAGCTSGASRSAKMVVAALCVALPMLCAGQSGSVGSNPRTGTDDPRAALSAGMYDAGEAQSGMERLVSLPKPPAFNPAPAPVDPKNPNASVAAALNYANSDLAFEQTRLIVGNYYGVNFYDISTPDKIALVSTMVCPGGQGDVSVYGHLLFMSVEAANGRLDCGVQGVPPPTGYVAPTPLTAEEREAGKRPPPPPASQDRFRGVRIFDISDLKNPKQVGAVQSCRGSHTHTLVIDPKDKDNVYLYISGTSFVRQSEELAGCVADGPDKDPNSSLFSIDVVKVPLAHPEQAKIVASPRVFADASGNVNGLWKGGTHGEGTQKTSQTNECHDITVYSAIGLAAGACSGNGILLDIKDPVHPVRIDAVNDPNYAFWHSATFNNDGTKVLFTDEWGGGVQARCRVSDPMNWGADAIFDLKNKKMKLEGYYKMPAAQGENENCVAHNGSLIPVPGRDIEVQAWYQGGVSIVDFTDPAHPVEIGYFDRGPIDGSKKVIGGYWSAYWYNGFIYGSEIARGVDVFKLVPSKFLTQNEIDAAKLVHVDLLNVQNQQKMIWPENYVVARAYVDQLARSNALNGQRLTDLNAAIDSAEKTHSKKDTSSLKKMAAGLEKDASAAKTPEDAKRMHALAGVLKVAA